MKEEMPCWVNMLCYAMLCLASFSMQCHTTLSDVGKLVSCAAEFLGLFTQCQSIRFQTDDIVFQSETKTTINKESRGIRGLLKTEKRHTRFFGLNNLLSSHGPIYHPGLLVNA